MNDSINSSNAGSGTRSGSAGYGHAGNPYGVMPRVLNDAVKQDEEISLRELFDLIWSGRWVVVAMTVAFAIVGLLYAICATPIYTATGLVQVEQEDKGLSASLDELSSMLGAGGTLQTAAEIAIINSRMVLGKAADQLNMRVVVEPKTFPLIGQAYFRSQAGLDGPAQPLLGMGSYAWGGERLDVKSLQLPAALQDSNLVLQATDGGYQLYDSTDQLILNGKLGILERVKTESGPVEILVSALVARPGTEFTVELRSEQSMYAYMQKRVSVSEQGKDSGIIQISYQDDSPGLVAKVVTQIEHVYLQQNIARRSEEAHQSLEFLNKQLPEVKAKVDQAQARLNEYQAAQGSVDVEKETGIVLEQTVNLETQRLALQQQREQALQQFTSKHPVIVALDEQIHTIDDELNKIHRQVEVLPARQQEIFSLMRDLDVNTQLYTSLLNSSQELQVTKAGTVGNVRIIDEALNPLLPTSPQKALIAIASIFLGGVLGVAWIFLQRMLLKGIDRPEDVERVLGLPTYASVPYSVQQRRLAAEMRKRKLENGILAALDGADLSIEALRSLRTSLHFAMLEAANNIVMFTSPAPNIGKSFISMNLGAVLAMAGKKVVVIDGDLRRGRLHDFIARASAPGLSEYVAGVATEAEIISSTPVLGLELVCRGLAPPNPSEILMNERFSSLIAGLSERFDYVIIDTPPVLPVADPSIIGRLAGTTFVVLKSAEHPMRTVEETVRRLRSAGIEPRGVLFNQVGAKVGSYGYGHYGYAYGYAASSYRAEN